jgi:hypothetical protein
MPNGTKLFGLWNQKLLKNLVFTVNVTLETKNTTFITV